MSEYRSVYVNSHALIVGINTYSDPRFMPLGQAESDAQSMAAILGAPPYNFTITQILGADATKSAILKALNQLRRAQPDDRVLVYFAGHGYTLSDRLGNETGFLACADTVPEEDFSALKLEDVIDLTRHSEAKHIGFVFDACFSGQALGLTRAPSVTADKLMQRRAYQVISAGAGDQTVSDYRSMTGRIVEALQSGVLLSDGLVTMGELGLHVQQTITADSHQTQIPQFGHIRGSQGGDFVFYVDTAVRLPAELEDVLRSNRATVRLSGVIELIEVANEGDTELAQVARDRLASIVQSDPEERVREAAQSYFDEQDAQREADEVLREAERKAQEAHRRADAARQARNLTPPKAAPKPAPAPEPAASASSEVYGYQGVYSDAPITEAPPAPASTPVVDRAGTGKPSLPVPMLFGIGGIVGVIAVGALIAVVMPGLMRGTDGDNENDNQATDTPTQTVGSQPTEEASSEPAATQPQVPTVEEIVFGHSKSGNNISVMNADGSGVRVLNDDPQVYSPDWSPDGSQIVYSSDGDIWVMNADGSNPTQLTDSEDIYENYPSWSPSGTRIAFDGTDSESSLNVYIMEAKGTNLVALTNVGSSGNPEWSPDGSQIAFESARDGNWNIWVMDGNGANQTRLTTSSIAYKNPAWSPDGDQIVFSGVVGTDSSNEQLYMMNSDGSGLVQFTAFEENCENPAWSSDGLKIACEYDGYPNQPDIMVIDSDGSDSVRLTLEGSEYNPSWRPITTGSRPLPLFGLLIDLGAYLLAFS